MENDKITIEVQITPKKSLEYITLNFTMDKWSDMFSINKKRQKKIKSILDEYKKIK
jgi:P2-related tail formation protein